MRVSVTALFLLLPGLLCAEHDSTVDFKYGGRIKLDALYNNERVSSDYLSSADLALIPSAIPITSRNGSGTDYNLRESRIWTSLRLPVLQRTLSVYSEIDFFDSRRDRQGRARPGAIPRLRHLYASSANLGLGQTYSSFLNISAFPEINDANGPAGVIIVRQPLIWYQQRFGRGEFRFSIEEPATRILDSRGRVLHPDDESVPDLVARLTHESDAGNISMSGMLRKIEADRIGTAGRDEEQWGGAISVAGRWQLFDRDNLRFTLSFGNALGRYLSYNVFRDAAIDDQGNIDLTSIIGGHISWQHWWTSALRSTLALGLASAEHAEHIVPASTTEQIQSSHLNLIWNPIQELTMGVEWIYAHRELINNRSGQLNRLQFTAIYKFQGF